ncbi:OpgC family protein [Aureimonas sp. AU4]|uniref:OpgC family protein n=1 Tax=Aureimonas sp. AU4 TaxID=1638163 RepID=UPI000780F26A|nr:OpgC domain-containing protein [Aureimonas sp. AU4]
MRQVDPERTGARRVLSIDFWRGLALLTIFVNHMPGNAFERFTHRNVGFSDATEVFVLLAGVAVAFVYLPLFRAGRGMAGAFRILQRAFQLYMAQIVLVILSAAVIARTVAITGDLRFYEMLSLDVLINDTVESLMGLATLGLQPAYLNILPVYIALLAAAPVLLFVRVRLGRAALLLASGALYVAAQLLWLNVPTYPVGGWWFLNPFAWQLLFVIGILLGERIASGEPRGAPTLLDAAALLYVLLSAVWIVSGFRPEFSPSWLPRFAFEFDKTYLTLPRLLHVLALALVVSRLPLERWLAQSRSAWPFVVLGRHSLSVFSLGTILAIIGQMIRTQTGNDIAVDSVLVGGGILIQLCLAGVLEWQRSRSPSSSPASSPAR